MTIRLATEHDRPQMVILLAELFALEPDFLFLPDVHDEGLRLLQQDRNAAILVVEDPESKKVVGMVTLQPHVSTGFGVRDAILEDLVIQYSYRGKGLGQKLLQAAEAHAQSMGLSRLRLVADMNNTRAHSFYAKNGWETSHLQSWFRSLT